MKSESVHLTVTAEHDGLRLDRFLTDEVNGLSRSRIQQLIRDGRVTVGGRLAKPSVAIREGDTVQVDIPPPVDAAPAAEDIPLTVLYEDDDLLVLDKPAGLVVHPAPGHTGGTLVNALLHHMPDLIGIGGERRPGIVHRLDRGTSGVMVVAKNDLAHEALSRQFHDRTVEKDYIALVWGVVQAGRRIDLPIGRDPVHRKKMSARARRARTAVTRIVRARSFKGVSLVRVAIHSGRTHQIRVHLSAIGHPVIGDSLYGGVRRRMPGDLRALARLDRPFLHAERLAFRHPRDERPMTFTAPLPPDLQAALDGIRPENVDPEEL